jgi:simple sugar transport system substrate-binding protein
VRPDAQVRVIWLQTWFDPARERDAAMTLINQGADVLAFHTASNAVMVAAQERGKMAVAYHSDMRKVAPDAQLLAVTHLWGDYYTQRVRALIEGRWQSTDTWGGVREGMVRVEGFGPKLSAAARNEVMARQSELSKGQLQVFKGPIWNDQGQLVVPAGQALSDAQILGMNFRVQGVR